LAQERAASDVRISQLEENARQREVVQEQHIQDLRLQLQEALERARRAEDNAAVQISHAQSSAKRRIADAEARRQQAVEASMRQSQEQSSLAAERAERAQQEAQLRVDQTQSQTTERVGHAIRRAMTATKVYRQMLGHDVWRETAAELGHLVPLPEETLEVGEAVKVVS